MRKWLKRREGMKRTDDRLGMRGEAGRCRGLERDNMCMGKRKKGQ